IVTLAVSLSPPVPFVVATLALFDTTPQSTAVVEDDTWITGSEVLPATVPRLQFNTWLPMAPVIKHPVYAGSRGQFRSPLRTPFAFAGRLSVTVTPSAGIEPELLTVMSNPIVSPALTGPGGLADFATSICAPTIVLDSLASVHVPETEALNAFPPYDATHTY